MVPSDDVKDLMLQDAGTGFEDFEAADFIAPFLMILQTGSPQLKEDHQLYVPDAKPGRIINTQSNRVYKEVHVIPCRYKFRYTEWKPRGSGGGFVGSFDRGSEPKDLQADQLTGLLSRTNGNQIQSTGYYLALLMEEGNERVIIPMYSTQLKKSRQWNSRMMSLKLGPDESVAPMFSHIWKLSTVAESNNKGSWYGWKIDPVSQVIDVNLYLLAKKTNVDFVNFLPERLLASMKPTSEEELDKAFPDGKKDNVI